MGGRNLGEWQNYFSQSEVKYLHLALTSEHQIRQRHFMASGSTMFRSTRFESWRTKHSGRQKVSDQSLHSRNIEASAEASIILSCSRDIDTLMQRAYLFSLTNRNGSRLQVGLFEVRRRHSMVGREFLHIICISIAVPKPSLWSKVVTKLYARIHLFFKFSALP